MHNQRQAKGELTRQHVFETALKLFRRRGFERTTMREIAEAADLSLGAAYHYFPSKDALIQAYYAWLQDEHERVVAATLAPGADLKTKLNTLLLTKLDLLRRDRKLLATLFGNLGDPSHPLSLFGKETAAIRERSIAQFVATFEAPSVPEELRDLLGVGFWLAHLGMFLFFVHDSSPNQARTHRLVDTVVDLATSTVPLLAHPLATPIRKRLLDLMAELDPRGTRT